MYWLSNSEINEFRRCKRKWAFTYYYGYQRINEPIYFTEGTLWHEVMEAYYRADIDYRADAGMGVLSNAELHQNDARIDYKKWRNLLRHYHAECESSGLDHGLAVAAVERTLSTELFDGVGLRGQVDLLFFDADRGILVLPDHKSAASFRNLEDTLLINQQVRTYALLCAETEGLETPREVMFNVVRKVDPEDGRSKPPYFTRLHSYVSDGLLAQHREEVCQTARDIMMMREFLDTQQDQPVLPPTVDQSCSWCQYNPVCQVWNDPAADPMWLLGTLFVEGDPNARYNQEQSI